MTLTAEELRVILKALGNDSDDPVIGGLQAKLSVMLEVALRRTATGRIRSEPAVQSVPVRTELGRELLAAYRAMGFTGPVEHRRQGQGRRGLDLPEPQTPEEARRIFLELTDAVGAAQSTDDPEFVPVWEELCRRQRAMKAKWALPTCKHGRAAAAYCPECELSGGAGFDR